MEKGDLNRYFFDALRQALNLSDTTYVNNYRIWFYELDWAERKATRPGYLFFGAPDERSTAQPPRDFYVYVLPPFLSRDWHDEERSDEVIFQLTGLDQAFEALVRTYAGARAMAGEAATHRAVYAEKADHHLRRLLRWLREHLIEHTQVTYQAVTEPIGAILARTRSTASQTIEELLRLVAAHLLTPDFEERYPDYPAFRRLTRPVSEAARVSWPVAGAPTWGWACWRDWNWWTQKAPSGPTSRVTPVVTWTCYRKSPPARWSTGAN
jgi:hypothetical protein